MAKADAIAPAEEDLVRARSSVAGPRLRDCRPRDCRPLAAQPARAERTLCGSSRSGDGRSGGVRSIGCWRANSIDVPSSPMAKYAIGPQPFVLFPGSFNPMHEGNVLLARVAEELRQQPLAFEISVTNVDKPPLAGETVRTPARQIRLEVAGRTHRAPTFVEKSRRSGDHVCGRHGYRQSGCLDRKYYGDDEGSNADGASMKSQFRGSFLVAVRLDAAGRVRVLNDIPRPRYAISLRNPGASFP